MQTRSANPNRKPKAGNVTGSGRRLLVMAQAYAMPDTGLTGDAGLADAAQKVGGMGTGLFGYENASETMRVTLEALKGRVLLLYFWATW